MSFDLIWENRVTGVDGSKVLVSTCCCTSKQQAQIAVALNNGDINVYSSTTGKLLRTLKGHLAGVSDVAYSPNGKYLASGSDDLTIRIWDTLTFQCVRVLKSHTYHVTCTKFNSKSNILISGSSDENIRIWDILRSRSMRTLSAHSDPIASLDLSFDDTIIVSGSHDGLIRLFDTETGACLKTLITNSPICQVALAPNAKFILTSSLDNKLSLWDYMNNEIVKSYEGAKRSKGYPLGIGFVVLGPYQLIYACCDDGHVIFWDIQSRQIKFTLDASPVEKSPIMNVCFDEQDDSVVVTTVSLSGELKRFKFIFDI